MILGIDIGTTGTKSILFDDKGTIVTYSYQGYGCYYPHPGWVEQDINDIIGAVIKTLQDCTAKIPAGDKVHAICASVQSGTVVPLNPDGSPHGHAISWLDTRCGEECEELLSKYDENFFYRKTGWKLGASFNFIQIYKMRKDDPIGTKNVFFANVSDIITYFLVGEYISDDNGAGNLQLLNIEEGQWDRDLMDIAEIKDNQLGRIVPAGSYIGNIKPETAKLLNLNSDVKVYAGAQDQYCTAVGAGVTHVGDSMLSTGTSWVFMNINESPAFDDIKYPAVCKHITGGTYASFVYTPAGGSAYKWLKNNVMSEGMDDDSVTYDTLTELAKQAPIGSEGLMFLPYLGGTLYPSWKSDMKGMLYGLDFMHDKRHISRAVQEGVAFELNLMIEDLRRQGLPISKMNALGGATRSDFWMQIVSDVTNMPIEASTVADVAPIGAGVMAAAGAGLYGSYEEASKAFECLKDRRYFTPNTESSALYAERFNEYQKLNSLLIANN